MLQRYFASWILPISSPPIHDGWVAIEGGRVAGVGQDSQLPAIEGAVDTELGDVILLPGLVNAHTHLELSYLRDTVAPAGRFVDWIRQVMAARREFPDPSDPAILKGIEHGIAEARRFGTSVVGDISNTLVTHGPLAGSALAAVLFYELIRFRCPDPVAVVADASRALESLTRSDRVRTSLAAHAPYSVAPQLLRSISQIVRDHPELPYSVHVAESREEVQFIASAGGPWRALLEELGAWDPDWAAPGLSPVAYLDREGFWAANAIAVHGVQISDADLRCLASRGTTLVTCPRSNQYTGAGNPPVAQFYESGVRVAVGTDSLASTPDLNLFAELAAMRAMAPAVAASSLLDSATRQGALALGFAADYGTIEAGKVADLLAVTAPSHLGRDDVEEYLVSGIRADQIRWVTGREITRPS